MKKWRVKKDQKPLAGTYESLRKANDAALEEAREIMKKDRTCVFGLIDFRAGEYVGFSISCDRKTYIFAIEEEG